MLKSYFVHCLAFLGLLIAVASTSAQFKPVRLQKKDELRAWKAKVSGLTEARLLGQTETEAILELPDGKEIKVPFQDFSDRDLVYIGELITKELWKPEDVTPAPPAHRVPPTIAPRAPFNAQAVVKAWGAPDEPLKLTSLASWKLDRLPDHFEFSQNGELIYVVYFDKAEHLLFRAKDGKLLQTISYGTAPLTAAAISADGKFILATLGDQGCGVYDLAEQKQRYVHAALTKVNNLLVTAENKPRVFGSQSSGKVSSYPLLGGWGVTRDAPWILFGSTVKPADKTEMGVSADGQLMVYRVPADARQLYVVDYGKWGDISKPHTRNLDMSGGSSLALGNRLLVHCGTPDQLTISRFNSIFIRPAPQQGVAFRSSADKQVYVSPNDAYVAGYYPDRGQLTVYSVAAFGGIKRSGFPQSAKPKLLRFHWPSNSIATCTADGQVEVAVMSGYASRLELIAADIQNWLTTRSDDRIEKMASALEKDSTAFDFAPLLTKYALLAQRMRVGEYLDNPEYTKLVEGWLARNSKSRLARFYQAEQLMTEAWQARGGGGAAFVTETQWKKFREKLDELEPILASFDDEPVIPTPVYSVIFAFAKARQWDDAKVEKFVERMLKECPDNFDAHCARAEALMPRWGGTQTACREYADRVAKNLTGPAGDAMYALIAYRLQKYHGATVFTELGFDSSRVHQGLAHHFRNHLDSPFYHQIGLVMGTLADDQKNVAPYVKAIRERNEPPLPDVISDQLYPTLVEQLQLDRP